MVCWRVNRLGGGGGGLERLRVLHFRQNVQGQACGGGWRDLVFCGWGNRLGKWLERLGVQPLHLLQRKF